LAENIYRMKVQTFLVKNTLWDAVACLPLAELGDGPYGHFCDIVSMTFLQNPRCLCVFLIFMSVLLLHWRNLSGASGALPSNSRQDICFAHWFLQ